MARQAVKGVEADGALDAFIDRIDYVSADAGTTRAGTGSPR